MRTSKRGGFCCEDEPYLVGDNANADLERVDLGTLLFGS